MLPRGTASTEAKPLHFTKADERALEWCLGHFPFGPENPWASEETVVSQRPPERFVPFSIKDPSDVIEDTVIVGKPPLEIARYRGHWIMPTVSMAPPIAIFVERLTPAEMTIAIVRALPYQGSGTLTEPGSSRHILKWNGKAFAEEPAEPDGVGHLIRISQDGRAMFVVFVTRIEAMPGMCLISSKHY